MHNSTTTSDAASYYMADVRHKRPTRRRAVAMGEIDAGGDGFRRIVEQTLPKGDALAMAEIAGLQGAKQAANLMPLCHPLLLELVRLRCLPIPERQVIRVYCEVATEARTGVEMEALAGVSAALLTIYDLTKPVQPALEMGAVRLLFKEGGKKGLWIHPEGISAADREFYRPKSCPRLDGIIAATVTLSDRAYAQQSRDLCGPLMVERLQQLGAKLESAVLMPDGVEPLATHLRQLAGAGVRLCLCSGGTGFGPRDLTPEALETVAGRRLDVLGDMLRAMGAQHTPLAWLSRCDAVLVDQMLVLALPGSPGAVKQGLDILLPLLPHAIAMIDGRPHP